MSTTLGALHRQLAAAVAPRGGDSAATEALLLLEAALPEQLRPLTGHGWRGRAVDAGVLEPVLQAAVSRRLAGEPVDRIIGRRGFWTLDLLVTPATLSPRPDTETVVEAGAKLLAGHPAPLLLDMGTGTGAILLALLAALPEARGVGLDCSAEALAVAGQNAARCGLAARCRFVQGGWDTAFPERFHLVASNPPYIPSAAIAGLEPEVREHDPLLALDGGPDGLAAYRAILPCLPHLLVPGGHAVLEVGFDQAHAVAALATADGLECRAIRRDLGGIERVVVLAAAG
jgi:release factor glutamine methyltransferase